MGGSVAVLGENVGIPEVVGIRLGSLELYPLGHWDGDGDGTSVWDVGASVGDVVALLGVDVGTPETVGLPLGSFESCLLGPWEGDEDEWSGEYAIQSVVEEGRAMGLSPALTSPKPHSMVRSPSPSSKQTVLPVAGFKVLFHAPFIRPPCPGPSRTDRLHRRAARRWTRCREVACSL